MWLRVIIIALAIWLIIRFLRRMLSHGRTGSTTPAATMVRCEYCSLYLPESEAMSSGSHFYCCEEHKDRARK